MPVETSGKSRRKGASGSWRMVGRATARSTSSSIANEAALDLCNHLAAKKGGRAPEDYADGMTILEEIGVLHHDLRVRMGRMARFRNLLVHRYWRVDDREVHRVMKENLGDFDLDLAAIGQ